MTKPELGASPDNPVYFRFLRDEDNALDWKKIVVMLGLTVLSGYLATQSQRAGSSPDQMKAARMRFHRAVIQVAHGQVNLWSDIARHHADLYEIARL
jgi:hypothetical protein